MSLFQQPARKQLLEAGSRPAYGQGTRMGMINFLLGFF